ncbi:hypothetical protein BHM03_00058295 [Ensete ventricosum]|nr:hypothetical protein BHM03_00058295 [Ensete ventricosum]
MLMVGAVGGATACCSIFVAPQKEMLAMLKDRETTMVARLGVASPRLSRAGIDEGGWSIGWETMIATEINEGVVCWLGNSDDDPFLLEQDGALLEREATATLLCAVGEEGSSGDIREG